MTGWGLPRRFRYRGTDIDGLQVEPPALYVRGSDLNEMIGRTGFVDAVYRLLTGETPQREASAALDRYLTACMIGAARSRAVRLVRAARDVGSTPAAAAAAGILSDFGCAGLQATDGDLGLLADGVWLPGLQIIGAIPVLFAAAILSGRDEPLRRLDHRSSYVENLSALIVDEPRGNDRASLLEAILVAWHGGFGVVTPTVMVPCICSGTGVSTATATAAGILAGGPSHTGAAEQAMRLLLEIGGREGTIAERVSALLEGRAAQGLDIIPGYGHPLLRVDPRPLRLRALFEEKGVRGEYLSIYDELSQQLRGRSGLQPNIDAMSAAVYLEIGVLDPAWGSAIGLCSRVATMVAHIRERAERPPFGLSSRKARLLYERFPAEWL